MNVKVFRNIGLVSLLSLLAVIITGIVLCASPRTPIAKDGDWIPYEIRTQYANYSLPHGSLPYQRYYGGNSSCYSYGCSAISVRAANNSDVVVIIKAQNANGRVVGHAYLRAGNSYTFELPNGTYQTFFYYGKGWYPEKNMKGGVKGGFLSDEVYSKDNPQTLYDQELTYSLVLQQHGNFHTKSSSSSEVF